MPASSVSRRQAVLPPIDDPSVHVQIDKLARRYVDAGGMGMDILARIGGSAQGLIERLPDENPDMLGIPDAILMKPGPLTAEETAVMRRHPQIGYDLLSNSQNRFIQLSALIALRHQERYDGSGYPDGLVGEAIPLEARIVAVADVFDALISERPYKRAWSLQEAMDYLRDNGFQTWIVSGGGIDFMRPWADDTYGIPPQQIVGSQIAEEYQIIDGKPEFMRKPEVFFVDDGAGKPVVMLDTRNLQEVEYGTFKDALVLPIRKFTDLPEALAPHRDALRDSTVVSFCTGGIRCEKAALWMVNDGMDNVLQLDGGILGYFEEVGGEGYEGRCFVFDERVALDAELKPMVDQPLPEPRPSAF